LDPAGIAEDHTRNSTGKGFLSTQELDPHAPGGDRLRNFSDIRAVEAGDY
jgi:hypothetical protein